MAGIQNFQSIRNEAGNLPQSCICISLKNKFFFTKEWGFGGFKTPSPFKLLVGTFPPIKTAWQAIHSFIIQQAFIEHILGPAEDTEM